MTVKSRFAPSPTGHLHIGSARTALIVWLFCRKNNGEFLFRMDDTDEKRSKKEHEENIIEGLKWLGIDWDQDERQSLRKDKYDAAIEQLKEAGRLYACYETEEELALKRKSLLNRGLPPIYDREALTLTDEQKAAYEAEGRTPHWRFKMNHEPIIWEDMVRGRVEFNGKDITDPVMIRADGRPLYHISSVVDDIEFGITHVVRGEDHVSNSAVHTQMFEALGAKAPIYSHITLLGNMAGAKLSKRKGSMSVTSFRDDAGLEKMAVISLVSRIGTSLPIEPLSSMDEVIESFDFSKFSRNLPKFDEEELYRLNAKILHKAKFADVKDRLAEMGLTDIDEEFWEIVKPNLSFLSDIEEWWKITHDPVKTPLEDKEFEEAAANLLPAEPWDETTWKTWTTAVKDATGRKGKELFMPLRKALTGQDHGPELKALLPIIGRERVLQRLGKDA